MVLTDFFNNDLFHFKHIIILVLCLIVLVVGTILAVKYIKVKTFNRILLIVGIISESLKIITYILDNEASLSGYLPKTDLPFHLCSIQLIFILILNISQNEKLKHTLQAFMVPTCLVGGIAALLLATYSSRNNWVITFQYFPYHVAISSYAIYLLANKDIKFTIKDYLTTLAMLLGTFFIAIYINSALYYKGEDGNFVNINFMYVVNPPESGLPFLNKDHGWGVYIAHYALLALMVVTVTYIKPIIDFFKGRKKAKEIEQPQEEKLD